ncbi:MAG: RnfABCDGE type electron transport complex subunit D [Clostridia bacterium]|nr:RnfABCDGE type electron transport complex subunit D [Clostridia bacterium]MBR2053979.1 RnfABCDGE type electron transport complex subunit D [Clostridia bacterium]MBR6752753.1 RnfABCDGE type electron transport complex subunit D [Clostridia bacterium]
MNLRISTAPHIHHPVTTQRLMLYVIMALLPTTAVGIYAFGLPAAILLAISCATAVLCEFVWQKIAKQPVRVNDLSALVTGLIVGLNLPANAPWWIALIGSAFAVLIVKQLFGGLGDNFLNPAMAARAVLLASWPVHMTSYVVPTFFDAGVDAVTAATPLATAAQNAPAQLMDLFMGNIPGCIGEVSKLAILLGLVILLVTRTVTWHIPFTMVASVFVFSWVMGADPVYAILSGGVLFGAVFMATDYVTSPMTPVGQMIYAAGIGLIIVLIRNFGAYPEGVTYGILLMNIATPLIDRFLPRKLYGYQKEAKQA